MKEDGKAKNGSNKLSLSPFSLFLVTASHSEPGSRRENLRNKGFSMHNRLQRIRLSIFSASVILIMLLVGFSGMAQTDAEKAAANPVANKIALEYQSTFQFDYGREEKTGYVGVFQPVIPFSLGPINFINRPMLSIIASPEVTLGEDGTIPGLPTPPIGQPGEIIKASGVGDFTYQLFMSPAKPGKIIWGLGPMLTFPTASDPQLGNGKYAMGPAGVLLAQPGSTTLGLLVGNSWSYTGDSERTDTSQFMMQYFITQGLGGGWSVGTQPFMSANWKAEDKKWLVPIGGGINKLFSGSVPIQIKVHFYWHAVRPDSASNWTMMITVQPVILM